MEVARSRETLHWLVVGSGVAWAAFAEAVGPRRNVVRVDHWPDAVKHLVAFPLVRAIVLEADGMPDLERAIRQAYAMQPGVTVFVASTVDASAVPAVPRLSPGDVPPELLP